MINIAICDDDASICELIESTIEGHSNDIEVFYTGEELIKNLNAGAMYDIIFLDIELNSVSGIDIGYTIRYKQNNQLTQIIYISSKENYAMKLFKIRPADFLVKPFDRIEIQNTYSNISQLLQDHMITFKKGYDYNMIRIKDIIYITSEARKLNIQLVNRKEDFYGKIDDYIKEFEDGGLIRIHKSCVVNPIHVTRYTYNYIMMSDGNELSISKPYKNIVRQQLMDLWRQKNDRFINC